MEIAELAVAWRDRGVAGFDIAGAEAGYPPTRHLDAFEYLQRENAHFTIHAGEAFGLPSIWQAIQWCGADRLGHGVRIADDVTTGPDGEPRLGLLAAYVRDKRIPLEMCPASNIQTGAAESISEHPIGLLTRLRFRVTVNTDNRLMSQTSMTDEMSALVDAFGYGLDDLRWFTINAMKSAFLPFDERLAIIEERRQARVRRAGSSALISAYARSGETSRQPSDDRVPDDLALGSQQRHAATHEHERRLPVLAQVAGQPTPERDERVLRDAVRRGDEPLAATGGHDLLREDPLRQEQRAAAEVEQLLAAPAVARDVVDRDRGPSPRSTACGSPRARPAHHHESGWSQSVSPAFCPRVMVGSPGSDPSL